MADFSISDVFNEIANQAPQFGVNPLHAAALFMAENSGSGNATSGNGDAVSPKGANGVFQVMPATAKGLQKAGLLPADWKYDPNDLSSQVSAGLAAIKDVTSRMGNPDDLYGLAAGYNGSPAVQKAYYSGKQLPAETSGYLKKVQVAAKNLGINMPDPTSNTGDAGVGNNPDEYNSSLTPSGITPSPSTPNTGMPTTKISTRTPLFAPGTLENYTNAVAEAVGPGGVLPSAAAQVIAGGDLRANIMATVQKAINDKAQADGQQVAAESARASNDAVRRAAILSANNINPDDTDNLMVQTSRVIDDTDSTLRSLKPEIDQRMGVGMFDNPFQWLVNQTILPGLVSRYNNVVTTQNAAIDSYKAHEQIASAQQSVSNNLDADQILRSGVAKQASIAAAATEALSNKQLEANAATTRDAMVLGQLAATTAGLNMHLASTLKEQQINTQGLTGKAAKDAEDAANLAAINKLVTVAGGMPIPSQSGLKMLTPKKRQLLEQAVSTGKLGDTFGDSLTFINQLGNLNNLAMSGSAAAVPWIKGTNAEASTISRTEIAKITAGNPNAKYDPEKIQEDNLTAIQHRYELEQTDMSTASKNNPQKFAYEGISKLPALANNPLATFINTYGPASKDPRFATVNEQYLMDRFASVVSKGTMALPDAVKAITDYYKTGYQEQAKATMWPLMGMSAPTGTYNVKLAGTGGAWGANTPLTVDLGDPVKVENYLTRAVARTAQLQNNIGARGGEAGKNYGANIAGQLAGATQ